MRINWTVMYYYLLFTLLVCNPLLLLALIWLIHTLISRATLIILSQFKFSRPRDTGKFLDCPIAHRCGTPENSLAGIRWCKQRGAVAVEMDLNLTKDHVPVLYHDNISHVSFEEAETLAKGTVSTLHEALELCKELNLRVFLDVKTLLFVTKVTEIIKRLYMEDQSLYDRMVVCSFSPLLIMAVRRADQRIPVAITHRNYALTFDQEGKRLVYKKKLLNFIVPYLDRSYVKKWRRRGVDILAWTVNDKDEQTFCDNVLKIPYMTDYPET